MVDGPLTSVLDPTKSKFSDDWLSLLQTDDSLCEPEVPPAAAGTSNDPPPLRYTTAKYWDLSFDTTRQPRYEIQDSLLLSLSSSSTLTKDVDTVLTAFGVLPEYRSADSLFGNIFGSFASFKLSTDEDARNHFWITPGHTSRFDIALTFEPVSSPSGSSALSSILQAIKNDIGIDVQGKLRNLSGPWVTLQRTCTAIAIAGKDGKTSIWQISSTFRCTVSFAAAGLLFHLSLSPTGFNISVIPDNRQNAVAASDTGFWDSLSQLQGLDAVKPSLGNIFPSVQLLKFAVGKSAGQSPWWQITTVLQWGGSSTSSGPKALQVYLGYDSHTSTFAGGLVGPDFYMDPTYLLLPTYVPGMENIKPSEWAAPQGFDLGSIADDVNHLPIGFPTTIAEASVFYRADDPKLISLSALLVHGKGSPSNQTVPCPFNWTQLQVQLTKGTDSFSFSAAANFVLSHADFPPADLGVMVSYQSSPQGGKEWVVGGFAENLSCGLLTSFFDKKFAEPMNKMVGNLSIASLSVMYTHKNGAATSFLFSGTILFGDLQLNMFYQYASADAGSETAAKRAMDSTDETAPKPRSTVNGNDWSFECDLKEVGKTATIGVVFASITGEPESTLPLFVAQIVIPAGEGRDLISLKVSKSPEDQLMFALSLNISTVRLQFIQITSKDKSSTKRIIIVSVGKLPTIDGIPLIGQLPQPFDKLEYMWVGSTASDPQGITQADVEALNKYILAAVDDKLDYKKTVVKVEPEDKVKNVVLLPGHHFIIVHNSEVALDHVFGTKQPKASVDDQTVSDAASEPTGALVKAPSVSSDTPTHAPAAPAKGALTFKFGPLSISAITLQYKEQGDDKILTLTMDATFTMGPLSFTLLGFGLGLPISKFKLNDLTGIAEGLVPELMGLDLSFNKPPLLIAGGFEHQNVDGNDIYMGGVGIGFPPYTFVGVGEYAKMKGFKSVFLYAKLDGPILTLEFATIEGVRIGFGFNSLVNSPTLAQIFEFPFINDNGIAGAANDPMKLLDSLCKTPISGSDHPWVVPKLDSFWLAAGMRVTAFDLLKITAVAMLAFRDTGVVVSIFADAVATMPPNVPPDEKGAMILYVEIGLIAEMNFIDGYFRVEAALSPSSFVLVPQCQVYGGFALVYWFPPNSNAGDWVFSVGGYHRSFKPPDHYPVPNRLGMSFNIGILSITGEGYFAITPKVAMGGALIHASLAFGPIHAWLDAAFDALINFHPLHYIVDFTISVGVEFDIDVWFVHIHIGASVGADLHIEGPEFGGVAHVDFYLFGFSVEFGATNEPPPPMILPDFWSMVHQPGPNSKSMGKDDTTPPHSLLTYSLPNEKGDMKAVDLDAPPFKPPGLGSLREGAAHKFVLEDGNFPLAKVGSDKPDEQTPPANTGAGAEWHVKGGTFRFRILSDFAISEAHIAKDDDHAPIDMLATTQDICSKPMRISESKTETKSIKSVLNVTVHEAQGSQKPIGGWTVTAFVVKNVPRAVWGSYSSDDDPIFTKQSPQSSLLNGNDPSMPLCMGISLCAPPPILAKSMIPVFNATDAAKMPVLDFRTNDNGDPWCVSDVETEQRKYLAADATAEQEALFDVNDKLTNLNHLKHTEASTSEVMEEIDKEIKELTAQKLKVKKGMWDGLKTTWQGLDSKTNLVNDDEDGVIACYSKLFEWNKRPPANTFVQPSYDESDWTLKCKTPAKLKVVKRLEELYLALPRMAFV